MREFTVFSISSDYATLKDSNGEELFIAMALLPQGTDVNDVLIYENMEFIKK